MYIPMTIEKEGNDVVHRKPRNPKHFEFVGFESLLRAKAYRKTTLPTSPSFYNDGDLSSEYAIIVAFDKRSNTPLLSSRLYWDPNDIMQELKGDDPILSFKIRDPETDSFDQWYPDELFKYEYGQCFLVDRMSGNLDHELYKKNKRRLFKLMYRKIFSSQKEAKVFYALARRSTKEKLLSKYLRIGMRVIGTTQYCGREHWVLEGRFTCIRKHFMNTLRLFLSMRAARLAG